MHFSSRRAQHGLVPKEVRILMPTLEASKNAIGLLHALAEVNFSQDVHELKRHGLEHRKSFYRTLFWPMPTIGLCMRRPAGSLARLAACTRGIQGCADIFEKQWLGS